jgi:hypothetical protein
MRRPDDRAAAPAANEPRLRAEGASRSDRIRAYLDDRLDEQELERFELELFDDPLLLQDVEAERALRDGLRDLDADLRAHAERLRPPVPLLRRALPLTAALAAGALIPTMAWLLLRPADDAATVEATAAAGSLPALQLGKLRGDERANTVLLPAGARGLRLQFVRPRQAGVRDYSIELTGPGEKVQRFDALRPGPDMLVKADVPGAQLPAGSYTARLLARHEDGSSSEAAERDSFILSR